MFKAKTLTDQTNFKLNSCSRSELSIVSFSQEAFVRQLDALRAEIQKLEAVYKKKFEDFVELKKSILLMAFAGELKIQSS